VPQRSTDAAQRAPAAGEAWAAEGERWESGHRASRPPREPVARRVPPWRLCHATPQTSQAGESRGPAERDASTACSATPGVPATQPAVDKVRPQRAGVAALGDVGWQSVGHAGQPVALTPRW
jgi:hypothetical protein